MLNPKTEQKKENLTKWHIFLRAAAVSPLLSHLYSIIHILFEELNIFYS